MHVRRALALAGAVMAAALAGCDVPFAPHWDADMYLPLTTQPIALAGFVPAPPLNIIPAGQSAAVSFPPQKQDVTGAVRDVLKNLVTDPARARTVLTLTVSKTTQISANDTLFVAPDSLSLTNPNPGRVVFPVSLAPTDLSKTDSLAVSQASITMLQNAGNTKAPLWIQVRGQVSNPSGSNIAITAADSIIIKLTVTARVAVSHN